MQARALLDKAERMLPGVAAEDRQDIEQCMAHLRGAVAARQLAEIEAQSAELADVLFYLEEV